MADNATDQLQLTNIPTGNGSIQHHHDDSNPQRQRQQPNNTSDKTIAANSSKYLTANLNNLQLHFSNINYVHKQSKSITNEILHDVCGELRSGRLTAILGPSGAGKTSLLNVLSGFKASGVTGNFTINGEERNLLEFRKMSSYIPQDFAMLDLLTVYETLRVSTDLKLPAKTTKKEKEKIINDILLMLNMKRSRNTLVCNLSGGERKRLSIGIELVTNPPIMFFDEPTSGLDSVATLQLITYLRKLASDGRLIACVVHQPSSRLMQLFDDVVVVSRGTILYSGSQDEMLSHFRQQGFECPQYYNPADFVLEVSSDLDNPNVDKLIEQNKRLHTCPKTFHHNDSETTGLLAHSSLPHTTVDMLSEPATQTAKATATTATIRPKEQVSMGRQFMVLLKRSVKSLCRNMISVQLRVIMHIVVAVLLGIVYWQIGNDGSKVLTNASFIFFVILFVFFGNAMPSIFLCPQECSVFIREYLNGWYSVKAYYLAKIVSDLPLQFICPTLLVSIAYFMTGQPTDVGRFVMFWGICLLTAMTGHFIGLMFGALFDMQMGVFLVPSFTIPMLIFSGFFIRIYEVAAFLRLLCDISFFRYAIEGILRCLYAYNRPDMECNTEFCYYRDPTKFLKDFGMLGNLYGRDVAALLIWIVALKVMFLLSLLIRIKRAQ